MTATPIDEFSKSKRVWFKAARDGDDKLIIKLLVAEPNLIEATDSTNKTALHFAAHHGHNKVVAQLLAINPALADARCSDGWTALHAAAQGGHENIVTQLLAARPCLLHSLTTTKQTPLHLAVSRAHDKVVALLLAAVRPIIQGSALNPLHASTELASIDARDFRGKTVLHCAVQVGAGNSWEQILEVRPELIIAVDDEAGCNPVHYALCDGRQDMAERMLAIKPEASYAVSKKGWTVLHYAVDFRNVLSTYRVCPCDKQFVAKVWRMNPQALHTANHDSRTPFDLAVIHYKHSLIELFRESVSFDELMSAFAKRNAKKFDYYQKKYQPVVKRQCKLLWQALNQDLVPIVFEYLGFPHKRQKWYAKKRTRIEEEEEEEEGPFLSLRYELRSRVGKKNTHTHTGGLIFAQKI